MDKFERIETAMQTVQYEASDVIKSTCLSALNHSIDENGDIVHTTMSKLQSRLADDYDITPGGAESRIRTLRNCMMKSLTSDDRSKIFGEQYKTNTLITNYEFIYLLSKYIISIW